MLSINLVIILLFAWVPIKCDSKPNIIIVGSGPAGIAAAARLLENNFTKLTVLEAEGRIGGRIYSVKFGDAIVDLGAQWCHGQKNNTVYELAKALDVLEISDSTPTFYYSSHETIDPVVAEEISKQVQDLYEKKHPIDGSSLGQYIIKRYNEEVIKKYSKDYKKTKLASDMLDFFVKSISSNEGSFSLFDQSAQMDYTQCEGGDLDWNGNGYKTILDILLKQYPDSSKKLPFDDKLQLNKEVTKIIWDNDKHLQQVTVVCLDGSVYLADHVIFTPSLGVLKDRHNTLFEPALPENKTTVIKELGIAAVAKMLLHFPNKWWPNRDQVDFSFIWDEKDSKKLFDEFPFEANKESHWLMDLIGFSTIDKNPNVLISWFSGKSVPIIESLSDDQLIDGAMFVLRKFVGHLYNITNPDKMLRSKWYTNPHFLGTYSFQTINSQKLNVSPELVLSQPLYASTGQPTLLFAGEATHPIYYSTVHGAIETGQREADRLINLYK